MFKWKEQYNTGLDEIDEQHQKLFKIGRRLYEITSLNDGVDHYDEIMEVLEELRLYTNYHFQYEEKLMEKNNYENFKIHKLEHKSFVNKVFKIDAEKVDEDQEMTTLEILKFVANWIEWHILKTDFQYATYLKEKV